MEYQIERLSIGDAAKEPAGRRGRLKTQVQQLGWLLKMTGTMAQGAFFSMRLWYSHSGCFST
jgi:hypothetical protein